jgi:hypothetical protein
MVTWAALTGVNVCPKARPNSAAAKMFCSLWGGIRSFSFGVTCFVAGLGSCIAGLTQAVVFSGSLEHSSASTRVDAAGRGIGAPRILCSEDDLVFTRAEDFRRVVPPMTAGHFARSSRCESIDSRSSITTPKPAFDGLANTL